MKFRAMNYRAVAAFFWVLALVAAAIWSQVPKEDAGWDLRVYEAAMRSVHAGHDPYLDGMAVQQRFHAEHHPSSDPPPFTYVYSPMTLPLVRLAGRLPPGVWEGLYWTIYGVAVLVAVWVCLQMAGRREAAIVWLVAPLTIFFPGLLELDVIFSGNVAYILHGAALAGAYVGWKRGDWRWFYGVVLCASCFKAPMLYLLAIPVLSTYGQWWPAAITGGLGVALFGFQPMVWPATFRHYLEAVELQFSYNRDFSSSPAGLLANALYNLIPYQITSAVFFAFYGSMFFAILFYLSRRRFLAGKVSLQQWAPFLLVGVLLLNPRIMEYDIAPVTVAMLLVFWRFLSRGASLARAGFVALCLLTALNMAAPRDWRTTECLTLVCLFTAGAWDLTTSSEEDEVESAGETHADRSRGLHAMNA